MAWPIVLPLISKAVAATGTAALSGVALGAALKRLRDNNDVGNTEEAANELMRRHNIEAIQNAGSQAKSTLPNIPLVLRPEYRMLLEDESLPPLTGDETIPEAVAGGPTIIVEDDDEESVPPSNNNQDDDENWLDKYRRKKREHLREKRDIQADEANYERARLRAEQERARISRERISADKAYQEYLRSQGRSIPRPSVKARPITQGISRFFGGKGPATTNRFYNSPAMGTLEWTGIIGGTGLGGYYGGKALGWWGDNSTKESDEDGVSLEPVTWAK